jgi:AcrR family transcriptional regulator
MAVDQRGRRPARVTGDERYDSILSTAERLLEGMPLEDISIEDLARGAGISRSNFYFYFSSKDQVLLALLDRVIAEVDRQIDALSRATRGEPAAVWRRSIGVFIDVFTDHRSVAVAAISARGRSPEVLALWSGAMRAWVEYSTTAIEEEQARGAALQGVSARDLAIVLTLMNERVLTATFGAEHPALEQASALDVLANLWLRGIYGSAPPQ